MDMEKFRRRYRPTRIDENGDQLYVEIYPTGDELKAYEAQRKLNPHIGPPPVESIRLYGK